MLRRVEWIAVIVAVGVIAGVSLAILPGLALADPGVAREVTIYNQDFAVVSEETEVTLTPGDNQLQWSDLPTTADRTSFQVDWKVNADKLRIWEQNYSLGVTGQYELLLANLGRQVSLILEGGRQIHGLLRSAESGQILIQTEDELVSVNQSKVIEVRSREANFDVATTPSFSARVYSDLGATKTVPARLNYIAHGIGWQGDYQLEYDRTTGFARLNAWATVTNQTNFDYGQVKLRLVAGEVNSTPRPVPLAYDRAMKMSSVAEYAVNESATATRSDFSIYHLYEIAQITELPAGQTKQVRLSEALSVPMTEQFVYDARVNPREVSAKLVFTNDDQSGLGLPLPAGRVRVFTADNGRALRFAGEDRLTNLPEGAKAELSLGNAFGLTVERTQTDMVRPTKDSRQESYRISLANGGDKEVTVLVREHLDAGANWDITSRSHKYTKKSATQVEFAVTIPAKEEASLEYTVRYLYQA